MTKNVLLAGVGGQGLVLTTKLICDAAFFAGYDFKSNDVIGLSQRGGKVWGSVRIGEKVHSPNIGVGQGDFLLALEPLEGLRWSHMVSKEGVVIMNMSRINPVPVMAEKSAYPESLDEVVGERLKVISLDANEEGRKLGSSKIANTFLLGILAKHMSEISKEHWQKAIEVNVPKKTIDLNLAAFDYGYEMV